ncbi:MAG: ATP-binding protein [bacterium]|nr:ATP-binding protein [bacterium]
MPPVTDDPSKLKDILDNLVSNAIKYSHPDTSIHIITQNGPGDFVKIVVNDQGLGLTGTDRQKVFNGYQTLSARPTGDETSTGFGLMIVKRLVELMEGSVGVESKGKNKGSSFWFTLKKAV